LPLWIEFMKTVTAGTPPQDFPNVETLEKMAQNREVKVDTPDTAPSEDVPPGDEPVGPPRRVCPPPKTPPKAPGKTGDPAGKSPN
jgi:hypothetical protein